MSESELDDLMGEVGGPCTFQGMVDMFQSKMAGDGNDPDELIIQAFSAYDQGGKIDVKMFQHALSTWGDKMTKAEIDDISPYGASQLVNIIKNEIQRNPQSSRADICCAGSLDTIGVSPSVLASTESGGGGSLYSRCGKVGKVLYSVGAVFAAYEFYSSFNKAKELTKWLQRLRDSAELLKYNGTAKEVFNISLDLQVILAIFTEGEQEYEMVQ